MDEIKYSKQLDIILNSIVDGVFTVDSDLNITYFNHAAEKIIGISKDQALGQKCFDVFHANMCETLSRHTEMSAGGSDTKYPKRSNHINNTIKYILAGDCLQCHSGQFRNLTTYKNVKMYADNGLLKQLVQLGGSMHRFAGPDSRQIIAWVNNGAPK